MTRFSDKDATRFSDKDPTRFTDKYATRFSNKNATIVSDKDAKYFVLLKYIFCQRCYAITALLTLSLDQTLFIKQQPKLLPCLVEHILENTIQMVVGKSFPKYYHKAAIRESAKQKICLKVLRGPSSKV